MRILEIFLALWYHLNDRISGPTFVVPRAAEKIILDLFPFWLLHFSERGGNTILTILEPSILYYTFPILFSIHLLRC